MSIPGSASSLLLKSAAAGGYQIQRSLRFNSADSAYLSRTPASAGNRKTWTWAGWAKRSALGVITTAGQNIFGADNGSTFGAILFSANDELRIQYYNGSTNAALLVSTAVFRDPASWYHIQVVWDTSNATSADRVRAYVNGSRLTTFSSQTQPTQNTDGAINATGNHAIGQVISNGFFFNGYLADVHFIDGQALEPTSFGEFDATTGVWNPKAYTGTYGTNGFRLPFSDNSAATATTLGKDSSGNGNNWTPNNLSVTAGVGNDSLVDSPTNYGTETGIGGEARGNYCTLNPLSNKQNSLSNGNLTTALALNGVIGRSFGTLELFDNCYWEVTVGPNSLALPNANYIWNGIAQRFDGSTAVAAGGYTYEYAYRNDGPFQNNGSTLATYSTYTFNSVISYAYSGGKLFIAVNGTWQNSGNPVAGTGSVVSGLTGSWFPFIAFDRTNVEQYFNGGQRAFSYTAPSGFKALCTANLPAPTITKGSSYFDTVLYTGTGSSLTPTSSLGFSPDLVWIKGRSGATDHALYDTVRGAQLDLVSNSTAAETTQSTGLTAFNSNGFTVGALAKLNTNAATYAAWTWDAGSSTVTNTAGTISSQVRANASAGFSIVTYTGTGSTATVGHGLGVTPALIIVKCRNSGFATNWPVWSNQLASLTNSLLLLNTTGSTATVANYWGSAAPTSAVFGVGGGGNDNNHNTFSHVAYCFAPVAGYSAFGSYTGNGSSANGPFVYTGFRPRWVMAKCTSTTGDWHIIDSSRLGYNPNKALYANATYTESGEYIDLLSNGFRLNSSYSGLNASGATFIYAAFAENPFVYSRAR